MKKIVSIILLCATLIGQERKQEEKPLDSGSHHLGIGMGVFQPDLGFQVQYDYGFIRDWSIGIVFGSVYTYRPLEPFVYFSFRADYHFKVLVKIPEQMDWYFGVGMGPKFNTRLDNILIQGAFHTGYTYLFYKNMGLQIEVLGGINMLGGTIGFTWRIVNP